MVKSAWKKLSLPYNIVRTVQYCSYAYKLSLLLKTVLTVKFYAYGKILSVRHNTICMVKKHNTVRNEQISPYGKISQINQEKLEKLP